MFIDEVSIYVQSGSGGNGVVHFRKEKYINRGGPDGGDGGKGGDIILRVNPRMNTLSKFRHKQKFIADDGKRGGPKNQTGKSADDVIIEIPTGTLIFNGNNGELLGDLTDEGQQIIICKGGRGGRGNARFANSKNQAPRIAEKGEPGEELFLHLELRLIADIGIIGMPNAGKSSILAATTNAKPKIADYPFTTLVPNLGVVALDETKILVLADIPGLIEGAHTGAGLGDAFLRHIQRTKALIHVLDGFSDDPFADYTQINTELALFDPKLQNKPQLVVLNKIDLPDVQEKTEKIKSDFKKIGITILPVSAVTHKNLKDMLWQIYNILQDNPIVIIDKDDLPVYRPEKEKENIQIAKLEDGWRIKGAAVERAAEMTYWEYFQSVRRFHRILRAMGIEEALQDAGIQEGDVVKIGKHELEWTEEADDI